MLKNNHLYRNIFLLLSLTMTMSCAVQLPLSGGAKDERAPRLDSLRSDKNKVTNFQKKTLQFYYDEWIELENPPKVVVSPPLREKPTIKTVDKSVVFEFGKNEKLRENATYTIDFGESIRDLNEGNKAILKYVFSTGNQLDTLKVTAQVTDAFTQKPIEDALLMLYDDMSDSIVVKDIPFYYAKTDKTGFATIENVKKGNFKAFALLDENQNFKYDLATEKVGYLLQNVDSQDTAKNKIHSLVLSAKPRKLQVLEKNTNTFGLVKMLLPIPAEQVKTLNYEEKNQGVVRENDGDTLKIWYKNAMPEPWKIFVFNDSVSVKSLVKADFLKKNKLIATNIPIGAAADKNATPTTVTINPFQSHAIIWNTPLEKIDVTKIIVEEDSTQIKVNFKAMKDSLSPRKLLIEAVFQEEKNYKITLMPSAIEDIFERKNDTLRTIIRLDEKKKFADITVDYKNFDNKNQYIIELLDENDKVKQSQIVTSKNSGKLTFLHLNLAKYNLRIITDTNKNGRWDAADYFIKQPSESIFIKNIETLQEGFDTSVEIDLTYKK